MNKEIEGSQSAIIVKRVNININNVIVTDEEGTTEPYLDSDMPTVTYAKRKGILQDKEGFLGLIVIHSFTEVLQIMDQNFTKSKHSSMPVKMNKKVYYFFEFWI